MVPLVVNKDYYEEAFYYIMSVSQYESVTQEVGLIRSRVVFGLIGTVIGAVCVVCGPGSTKRSSVRLSAPSIDSSRGGVRQVSC